MGYFKNKSETAKRKREGYFEELKLKSNGGKETGNQRIQSWVLGEEQ